MKPHKFDPLSFIAGLFAVAVGLAFLLPADPGDIWTFFDNFGAWFWPVALVVIGIAIIAPAAKLGRSTNGDEEDPI